MRRREPGMNAEAAAALRLAGLKWGEIGKLLAQVEGRAVPYQAPHVARAVKRISETT